MSRNGSGTYTLPAGNPVVTGTTIESTWANTTLSDIATTLTDSLSRSGQGGMTAALRIADGTQGAPGLGFANETGSGLYRAGTGEVWAVVQGAQTMNLDANGVTVPSDKATSIEGTFVFNETGADKDARFEGDTDANLLFVDASADAVGIGTSSPATKLQVSGTGSQEIRISTLTSGSPRLGLNAEGSNGGAITYDRATSAFVISNGGVDRATLDLAGNLGLGVTPSAWLGAGYIDFPGNGYVGNAASYSGNTLSTGLNAYYGTGNWRYKQSSLAASRFDLNTNGAFAWYTAPSGTAGNAISFTQAMTLDASGNLGVGISSPQAVLHVNKATTSTFRLSATNVGIDIQSLDSAGYGLVSTYTNHPMVFSTNATERMRLDSSGNLLVGTTAQIFPTSNRVTIEANGTSQALFGLAVGGTSAGYLMHDGTDVLLYQTRAGAMLFGTNNTERARITSGGDLLVGTTSNTPANTTDVAFCAGSTVGYGSTWQQIPNNAPASYKAFTVFRGNVEIGSISYNGTGVNFNATSDRRLKENIAPAGAAGAVIDAIDIVQHDWKAGGHTRFGVIAQDLHAVAPEAVTTGDDNEEIERTWGVDYSKLVPMLIKEIQSLRARVAALEVA